MTQLLALSVSVPPLEQQKEFIARVAAILTMKPEQAASRRLDDLFQSMLHRPFNVNSQSARKNDNVSVSEFEIMRLCETVVCFDGLWEAEILWDRDEPLTSETSGRGASA